MNSFSLPLFSSIVMDCAMQASNDEISLAMTVYNDFYISAFNV